MGKVLHGSATTTHAVRKAIQRSKAAIKELSQTCGINPKTVRKWRKRNTVEDHKTGPGQPRSTLLSEDEEALIIAFRRHSTTASMRSNRPSRISPVRRCIAA